MQVLLIAVGNPLRRDDGIAHRVLEILDPDLAAGARTSSVHQLTPELAGEFSRHDFVVVVDADVEPGEAFLEEMTEPVAHAALGHQLGAAEVLALARALYDWKGACYVCHVPGSDFTEGGGFSDEAEGNAWKAARLIEEFLNSPSP
jgi:hydrogenase maturation protease